jgi:hypothetical protein
MINMPESKTETNTSRVRRRRKRKPMSKQTSEPSDASIPNDVAPPAVTALVTVAETATARDGGDTKTSHECNTVPGHDNAALYGLYLG